MRRYALLLPSLAVLASCGADPRAGLPEGDGPDAVEQAARAAPGAPSVAGAERRIPDQYIVVLDAGRDSPAEAARLARQHGAALLHVYRFAVRGFAARMSAVAAEAIAHDPAVAFVEEDGEVDAVESVEANATWGLDRIDERARVLDGLYHYAATGAGVHAYVIDTGIYAAHPDFAGRVGGGFGAIADGRGTADCNGHGTHVAGTLGSTTWGVAKQVTLHPVRVLDCRGSGSWSGVIAGVDWVTGNAARPAVANLSLGGGASSAADAAVSSSIASGVVYAVAAGNDGANACLYSPARVAAALTVGASGSGDGAASWSNRGSCVDLYAPGSSITSTWNDGATRTISGTSMASPHVAGAAALYLEGHASAAPAEVSQAVTAAATAGVLSGVPTGTPNLLLYAYTLGGGGTPAPEPPPPPPPEEPLPVASTPTFSPAAGGSFPGPLSVTIADATPGARIFYTVDGSTPTPSSTPYAGPIVLTASTTLRAVATADGYAQSAVASAKYNIRKR